MTDGSDGTVPDNNSTRKLHVCLCVHAEHESHRLCMVYLSSGKKKCNHSLSHLEMFSRASYYQLALEHLHSHAEALEALGTPLSVHYLQLTDKYNFEDIADAQVMPPAPAPWTAGCMPPGLRKGCRDLERGLEEARERCRMGKSTVQNCQ